MALSRVGRELWPPGLVTSSQNGMCAFSAAWMLCERRFPCASSSPPPPSFSPNSASIRARWFCVSQVAPLLRPPLSSPQVSTIFSVRRGRKPSWRKRISMSTQIAACALSSAVPRPKK